MLIKEEISELEIELVRNRSVLITSRVFKPLKVFQLKKETACQVVFSNYGGGFVEGDKVQLNILCGVDTKTIFSTQANTRVYKSVAGLTTSQHIKGKIGERALTVFLGDPLVPQKDSIFEQKIEWHIQKDSVLMYVDWFEAGRILNNERFEFHSYFTEFKVLQDNIPLVWDRFKIEPSNTNINSPGAFLNHSSYLNIFLVGNENLLTIKTLEVHLRFLASKFFQEEKPLQLNEVELLGAVVKINESVFLVRCSARNNETLHAFVKELSIVLEDKNLLGFNPLGRKF